MTQQMSNQYRRIRQIAEEIRKLPGTPLVAIGAELEKIVEPLLTAREIDVSGPVNHLIDHLNVLLSALPKTFGQRFMFDAALVLTLMDEWNPSLKLRRLALPGYDPRWGYRRLALPSLSRESTLVFDLFLLPGRDALDDVDFLDYPWIMHELGHCLLHLHPSEFPDAFRVGLESHFKNLRLLAVADRGRTREKATATLREAEQFWTPAEDQHDWAHEIAFDVFALWTCGPAFISAFHSTLKDLNPDPFIKKQDHPPYVVRVAALLHAAKKLRFDGYLRELSDTYRNQCMAVESSLQKNELLLFAPDILIQNCVEAAISVARNFELRRWREIDPDRFLAEPSFGSDLFAAAFKKSQVSSSNYAEWQQSVLGKLVASVTL
jgi:hypothetical protein